MIERFTNRYSLQKTLCFSLKPVGKTEENFRAKALLEKDEQREKDRKKVQEYIDRYLKEMIDSALSGFTLARIKDYVVLYNNGDKSDKERMKREDEMRKAIADALKNDERYKNFDSKDFINKFLPDVLTEDEKAVVASFHRFTTYFKDFIDIRKNMCKAEAKKNTIAYRCIHDNLPRFIDNANAFEKVKMLLPKEELAEWNKQCKKRYKVKAEHFFTPEYFSKVLPQSGITKYNALLGGYSEKDGSKIQGLNEYINHYNQQSTDAKLPFMKPLLKQILSDTESFSFIPARFSDDKELIDAVSGFYCDEQNGVKKVIDSLAELVGALNTYDCAGIYIAAGSDVAQVSKEVFGDWSAIRTSWKKEYERTHKIGKDIDKFIQKEDTEYKKIKSFSIAELQKYGGESANICDYFKEKAVHLQKQIEVNYENAQTLWASPDEGKRLATDDAAIEKIKALLDSIKGFERLVKLLAGAGKEEKKDDLFYNLLLPELTALTSVDLLYNKVRNYLTQKPYAKDKIKLNFENSSFLSGWSSNADSSACDAKDVMLITKNETYFIAVIDEKLDENTMAYLHADCEKDCASKIIYNFQKVDIKNVPRLFIRSKKESYAPAIEKYHLPVADIIEPYDNKWFTAEHKKENEEEFQYALTKLIDYFKLGFQRHESYKDFAFSWKESSAYCDIKEFYDDTQGACYELKKENINFAHLKELADQGKLYLFQIYSKDFSEFSKGKPNLHTLYFKMLFDERNLENVVYKLSGGAEMFYRIHSIEEAEATEHPANVPLGNKNPDNPKKQSVFPYKLIKDRRFTKDQFSLHIPIVLNFKKSEAASDISTEVREALKQADKHYVIGIDRGERNLIYVSVIDATGKIQMQKSFNIIESDRGYRVDYHALLGEKENKRDDARKNWKTIQNIKELKAGYISQVVHEICKLVVKYDAILALEDLNSGFINSRRRIEKQVYQKFEDMLVTKLQFLADKSADPKEIGGLLNAYQLTENPEKKKKMEHARQNGIVFYVPAWLTSKIDPATGFVNLLNTKYEGVEKARDFLEKFDDISYERDEDLFAFTFDYRKFPKCNADHRKVWTIYTNGERIRAYRDKQNRDKPKYETVVLTAEFKKLFQDYKIEYEADLKAQILQQNEKDFFERLLKLLSLTLQMRNTDAANDYIISPVKNSDGVFYDSRNYKAEDALPCDADANGAYNIARKALWAIHNLKQCDDVKNAKMSITNEAWLAYAQKS